MLECFKDWVSLLNILQVFTGKVGSGRRRGWGKEGKGEREEKDKEWKKEINKMKGERTEEGRKGNRGETLIRFCLRKQIKLVGKE